MMSDDTPHDADDEPMLTGDEAAEVMALTQTALSDRVTVTPPIEGDLDTLIEIALDHHLGLHTLWLASSTVGVSLCASCGAMSMYVLTQRSRIIHGAVEIAERLRARGSDRLGGDTESILCMYRRVHGVRDDGADTALYVFGATYWIEIPEGSKSADRVTHVTRSMVALVDDLTEIIDAAVEHASLQRDRLKDDDTGSTP